MRHLVAHTAERLLSSYLSLYGLYCAGAALLTVVVWYWWGSAALSIPIAAFFLCELTVRAILRISYGPHYRFAIFTYFLRDDDRYGTGLAKSTRSHEVPFLLFDTVIFPPNTGRLLDLQKNK